MTKTHQKQILSKEYLKAHQKIQSKIPEKGNSKTNPLKKIENLEKQLRPCKYSSILQIITCLTRPKQQETNNQEQNTS